MSNNRTTTQATTSTAPLTMAPKNGKKAKRVHDRWEEFEAYVKEYKVARNGWPTISEAVQALQKRRPLASEADWLFVAKHYVPVEVKGEKESRVTSEVSDKGLQLALQSTIVRGREHSLMRLHRDLVEAYAKKGNKVMPPLKKGEAKTKAPKKKSSR